MRSARCLRAVICLACLISATPVIIPESSTAAPGEVLSQVMISRPTGGFVGPLSNGDLFGSSATLIGDLNADGVEDLAIGAMGDDDGGPNRGAVWVLFMNSDGTVRGQQKISATAGGFSGSLDDGDQFGSAIASLGDLNNDGVIDIAVGSVLDDDGNAPNQGAVWILFLNSDGTVQSHQKVSETAGGFTGSLDADDRFGRLITNLGDLDDDGVTDLAVSALLDDDNGVDQGAVWILFLYADGTVKTSQKISELAGGLGTVLSPGDNFGSVGSLGDLDGDSVEDLAVGALLSDDGGTGRGALWILFLNSNGTVKSKQKISDTVGGFTGILDDSDFFGGSPSWLGPIMNGLPGALAVSASGDDDGGTNRGAVWILFLNPTGTVASYKKISATTGGFAGPLGNLDQFGSATAALGDLNGDGRGDLAVGAYFSDDGGPDRGAAWVLFLDGDPATPLPTVACGGKVEIRCTFAARPGEIAVAPAGDIFVGNFYYSGQDADVVPISRVPSAGTVPFPCGDPIPDPDIVLLDAAGNIAPPGNILVGSGGRFTAVSPTCDTTSLVVGGHPLLGNPQDMDFDGLGRLIYYNFDQQNIVAYNGSSFVQLISGVGTSAPFAADSLDLYVTVAGVVRRYNLSGSLLDPSFLAGRSLKRATIGSQRGLLVQRADSLSFVALPSREERLLLTDLTDLSGIEMVSDSVLYLTQFNARRLLRVVINLRPMALCRNVVVAVNASCQGYIDAAAIDNGSFDPEGGPLSYSVIPPGPYPMGATNVALIVTDDCGLADTCVATVTVVNQPPVAVCKDASVAGPGASPCEVAVAPGDLNDGSFDPEGQAIILEVLPPGPYPDGQTPVQFIVSDPCGGADTCEAIITVICPTAAYETVPAEVCFPEVAHGDTVSAGVAIRSTGTADLEISSVTFCPSAMYSLDLTGLSSTVVPGDSTSFNVEIHPWGNVSFPDTCVVTVETNAGPKQVRIVVKTIVGVPADGNPPGLVGLARIAPNPFSASAHVQFVLPTGVDVRVEVFDSQGRRVRTLLDGFREAGGHELVWDGRDDHGVAAAAGVYLFNVQAGPERWSTRAVRIR